MKKRNLPEHLEGNFLRRSFTIVELLIVIVIIAVLATIVAVLYNGIQYQTRVASLSAEVTQVKRQLEAYKINNNEQYPTSQEIALANLETNPLSTVEYEYNDTNGRYCVTVAQYGLSRFVTSPAQGPAAGSYIGLVGWWPMNDSADDMSTTGNTTRVVGAVPAPGQNGQSGAYSFNGDYISCGTDIALRPTTAVTLSVWIYLEEDASGRSGIVNYGNGGYWLAVTPLKNASLYMSDTAIENTGAFPTGSWHHLAGSYSDGELAIYIDGKTVETSSLIKGNIENYGATECLIGSVKNAAGNYFEGSIDDVRIYNRVLTAEEIRDIYKEGAF